MADSKVTALTALAAVESTDLLYVVDDPAGTPLSKKATVGNVITPWNMWPTCKPIAGSPHRSSGLGGTYGCPLNRLLVAPMPVAVGHAYTYFGARVDTAAGASGVLRIGIYAPGSGGLPGGLITDGGTVSSATTGNKYVAINFTPVFPVVWVACVPQVDATSLKLNCFNYNNAFNWSLLGSGGGEWSGVPYQAGVDGALPATLSVTVPSASGGEFGVAFAAYAY